MIAKLTSSERQIAFVLAAAVAFAGGAMAILGGSDPLGVHGVIVMLFARRRAVSRAVVVLRA